MLFMFFIVEQTKDKVNLVTVFASRSFCRKSRKKQYFLVMLCYEKIDC